jgi:hypothetical protein
MQLQDDALIPPGDPSGAAENDESSSPEGSPENAAWWVPHLDLLRGGIATWTDTHPNYVTASRFVGPTLLALAGVMASSPAAWVPLLIVGVAILALSEFGSRFRGKKITDLEREVTDLEREVAEGSAALITAATEASEHSAKLGQQETVIKAATRAVRVYATSVLRRMAHKSNASFDVDCRISLYFVDGSELRIIARFSQDTGWHSIGDTTNTKSFPRTHGLIGTAMQTATRQQQSHEAFSDPSYANWQRLKCNLVGIKELRMKSEQYDVVPLRDPDTKDVVGVVSLETTHPTEAKLEPLADVLADGASLESGLLRDVIDMYSSLQEPQKIETGESNEQS